MGAEDVVSVLDALEAADVRADVAGGWGVDALLGEQTREHGDLDLLVEAQGEAAALAELGRLGYRPHVDWRPVRIAVVDDDGREVDLHPVVYDATGHGVQANVAGREPFEYPASDFVDGVIGGRAVRCLSAAAQAALHDGYPARDIDRHDLAVLARLARTPG